MTKKIFIIVVALLFLSCDRKDEEQVIETNDRQVIKIDDGLLQIITEAVDTLVIGSNSFVLDAYLWRDFMPGNTSNGMNSINWLIRTDSVKMPDNINMIKQYVIYEDSIWVASYENVAPTPSLPEYKIERVSINGPKWGGLKIFVDVISQIYDSKTNQDYHIVRKNVYIHGTS